MNQTGRFSWFRRESANLEITADHLPPVSLDPCFRSDLKQRLLAAHPELTERRSLWRNMTADPLRLWSVVATLPVIVGVVAFLWRRSQRTVQQLA